MALDEFEVRVLKFNYLDYITLKPNFQKTKGTFQDMEKTRTSPSYSIGLASKGYANIYNILNSANNRIIQNPKYSVKMVGGIKGIMKFNIHFELIEKALRDKRRTPINVYTKYILLNYFT